MTEQTQEAQQLAEIGDEESAQQTNPYLALT
jgi:hypothetical protein